MIRRYHDDTDEAEHRFWSGLLLAFVLTIPLWAALLYGLLALARRAGVIQ